MHWDLDAQNHPELLSRTQQALADEHAKALEEYKDLPLPFAMRHIKQRLVFARREAIHCYCRDKGLERHHVMAKGPPNV